MRISTTLKRRKTFKSSVGVQNGNGVIDKRNQLNDLTGREWVYFLNSVWITGYSTTAKDTIGFDLRKVHPCPKPPQLMRDIILFFTKGNGLVLDPFAGVGGTLLGASLCKGQRRAVGLELNSNYVQTYKKVCKAGGLSMQKIFCDDARNMGQHSVIRRGGFDLILTDPPYNNMMTKVRTGPDMKNHRDTSPRRFSNDRRDIGNLSREDFLIELQTILGEAVSHLKIGKYLVVFCKDFQPSRESSNLLHADVIEKLSEINGLVYRGMKIWHDQAYSLYPFGYPFAFVMNQLHQYILIFRKEH